MYDKSKHGSLNENMKELNQWIKLRKNEAKELKNLAYQKPKTYAEYVGLSTDEIIAKEHKLPKKWKLYDVAKFMYKEGFYSTNELNQIYNFLHG